MSWCCRSSGNYKTIYPESTFDEFTSAETGHKKFKREIINHQPGEIYSKYEGWERVKFRSKDYREILSDLKSSGINFQDPDFLHVDRNIGSEAKEGEIEWRRVTDFVNNAVYSHEHSAKSLQEFKCGNKALQNALGMIARVKPQKFIDLLTRDLK